jgi:hypothetical protein
MTYRRFAPFLCLLGIVFTALSARVAAAPIATADGEEPGLRLEVQELKRVDGGMVMLRFTVANNSNANRPINLAYAPRDAASTAGIYLVDSVNRKKHEVVRDSEGRCLCSQRISSIGPGANLNLWARFPAPPEGVRRLGVVVPHFAPVDDVPVSQ